MKSEFGGKIRHWFLHGRAGAGFSIGILAGEIFLEGVVNLFQLAQKSFVGRELFQSRLARELEHANGIMIGPVPEFGIEMTKEAASGRLPRPPDVKADFAQRLEGGGKGGDYVVTLEIRHGGNWWYCHEKVRKSQALDGSGLRAAQREALEPRKRLRLTRGTRNSERIVKSTEDEYE